MNPAKISELQREARRKGYALPHFLGGSLEMVVGEIKAAEEAASPIAIGFAPEVFHRIPMAFSLPMIANAAKQAKVPVAVQLEHGRDFEMIMGAIKLGMTSVMYDGSGLPYEENIANTKEIVKAAHAMDVSVEAELGSVGGSALRDAAVKGSRFTDPDLAADFIMRTGVDSLAISFGNVHGKYYGDPVLQYGLVRKICSLVDAPLVMHGGSGLTQTEYRSCIGAGISTIHFYTGIAVGVWEHLVKSVKENAPDPVYHEIVGYTIDYFYDQTLNVINMLKSSGMA
jgi:fructose-bisphosphate aldolase class II